MTRTFPSGLMVERWEEREEELSWRMYSSKRIASRSGQPMRTAEETRFMPGEREREFMSSVTLRSHKETVWTDWEISLGSAKERTSTYVNVGQ